MCLVNCALLQSTTLVTNPQQFQLARCIRTHEQQGMPLQCLGHAGLTCFVKSVFLGLCVALVYPLQLCPVHAKVHDCVTQLVKEDAFL
jgi:hypothetical protein